MDLEYSSRLHAWLFALGDCSSMYRYSPPNMDQMPISVWNIKYVRWSTVLKVQIYWNIQITLLIKYIYRRSSVWGWRVNAQGSVDIIDEDIADGIECIIKIFFTVVGDIGWKIAVQVDSLIDFIRYQRMCPEKLIHSLISCLCVYPCIAYLKFEWQSDFHGLFMHIQA